jgi:hypothetical protein
MLGFIAFPGGSRGQQVTANDPVAAWLDDLPANYDVYHAVETSEGDLEHLVVSYDRGVFLIESRSAPGRITVQGDRLYLDHQLADPNLVEATMRRASWLRNVLSERTGVTVPVTPVVVFTAAVVPDDGRFGTAILTDLDDLGMALSHTRVRAPEATRFWQHRRHLAELA